MRYRAYPEYKDSEVEWLGEIPAHWIMMKAKYRFILQRGHDLSSDKMVEGRYPVYGSNGPIGIHNEFTTKGPSITVGRSGSVGEVNYVPHDFWAHNTSLYVKNFKNAPVKYIYYLLLAIDPKRLSAGSAVGTLDRNNIHAQIIATPKNNEAANIANFLDHETAKIDTLIEKQQQLIKLLNEKRQAVISHAVTKGLNPDAPMRDSGVEWLGEVPAHWGTGYSKWHFSERNTKALTTDEMLTASQKYGIISQKEFMSLEQQKVVQVQKGHSILKHVEPHDFVISMRSFQGGIEYSPFRGSVSSAYVPLKPTKSIFINYFRYLFKCKPYIQALQSTTNLVRDGQALRYNNFVQVRLPIVPEEEQKKISSFLDQEIYMIYALTQKAKVAIKLMNERRTALISAAVTGKIDVRDWKPPEQNTTRRMGKAQRAHQTKKNNNGEQ